jgi:hypothetical protein
VVDEPTIEKACPLCGEVVTGPEFGRGNVNAQLALHKGRKHRKKGSPNKASSRPEPPKDAPAAITVLRDAANEIGDSTKPPSQEELRRALARFFGTTSVAAASYMVETDPTLAEHEKDGVADYLSLPPEDANEIAYPLARSLYRTTLNKRYGRTVVDNLDTAGALTALVMTGVRWRRYLRERERRMRIMNAVPAQSWPTSQWSAGGAPVPPPGSPAGAPVPPFTEGGTGPAAAERVTVPDISGHVWTKEELDAQRRQNGHG